MRLGLVIYGSLDTVSGGFLYDKMLVDFLRDSGDEVEVISLPWRSYPVCLTHNLSRDLGRKLRPRRFDLLLQDELNHPSLFWLNRGLGDVPIVTIVHHLRSKEQHPHWKNVVYRWIEGRYLATIQGFVFNSRTTKADVEAVVGTSRPHVVAHPGGDRLNPKVSPERAGARALGPGPLRVLFLGNIIPRKGLHTLVSALGRVEEEWTLEVVGGEIDADYASNIRSQISRAGLNDRVTMMGPLLDDRLASRLEQSHILAVPSSYEGFGIVYLEGMGFGLPAIATTSGAAHETIDNENNGFLVFPDDVHSLADRISQLSRDRALLTDMGQAALQTYAKHPTWADTTGWIRGFLLQMPK